MCLGGRWFVCHVHVDGVGLKVGHILVADGFVCMCGSNVDVSW